MLLLPICQKSLLLPHEGPPGSGWGFSSSAGWHLRGSKQVFLSPSWMSLSLSLCFAFISSFNQIFSSSALIWLSILFSESESSSVSDLISKLAYSLINSLLSFLRAYSIFLFYPREELLNLLTLFCHLSREVLPWTGSDQAFSTSCLKSSQQPPFLKLEARGFEIDGDTRVPKDGSVIATIPILVRAWLEDKGKKAIKFIITRSSIYCRHDQVLLVVCPGISPTWNLSKLQISTHALNLSHHFWLALPLILSVWNLTKLKSPQMRVGIKESINRAFSSEMNSSFPSSYGEP